MMSMYEMFVRNEDQKTFTAYDLANLYLDMWETAPENEDEDEFFAKFICWMKENLSFVTKNHYSEFPYLLFSPIMTEDLTKNMLETRPLTDGDLKEFEALLATY